MLAELDAPDDLRARVHTPAGLDIGARTAAEIALSILAEIIVRAAPRSPAPPPGRSDAAAAASAGAADRDRPGLRHDGRRRRRPALHLEHEGTTWYFCGTGCLQAFADDPERATAA